MASLASYACLAAILGIALWWLRADAYSDGVRDMKRHLVEANMKMLREKAIAETAAADRRVVDIVAVNKSEKELLDAIAAVPDQQPDAVRVALGCGRLRAAGRDTTRIPACRRSQGGSETRPE